MSKHTGWVCLGLVVFGLACIAITSPKEAGGLAIVLAAMLAIFGD